MSKQVISVLFTCAMVVGSMAEEAVMEPIQNSWNTVWHPYEYRADCLELFACGGKRDINGLCSG